MSEPPTRHGADNGRGFRPFLRHCRGCHCCAAFDRADAIRSCGEPLHECAQLAAVADKLLETARTLNPNITDAQFRETWAYATRLTAWEVPPARQ